MASVESLLVAAENFRKLGDVKKAIQNYTDALSALNFNFEEKQENTSMTDILKLQMTTNRGYSYTKIGASRQALVDFQEAINLLNKMNGSDECTEGAALWHNLALIHQQNQSLKKAEQYYKHSLEIRKALLLDSNDLKKDNEYHKSVSLCNLGVVHYEKEEYDKAQKRFLEAMRLTSSRPDSLETANLFAYCAKAKFKLHHLDEALSFLQEAKRILKVVESKRGREPSGNVSSALASTDELILTVEGAQLASRSVYNGQSGGTGDAADFYRVVDESVTPSTSNNGGVSNVVPQDQLSSVRATVASSTPADNNKNKNRRSLLGGKQNMSMRSLNITASSKRNDLLYESDTVTTKNNDHHHSNIANISHQIFDSKELVQSYAKALANSLTNEALSLGNLAHTVAGRSSDNSNRFGKRIQVLVSATQKCASTIYNTSDSIDTSVEMRITMVECYKIKLSRTKAFKGSSENETNFVKELGICYQRVIDELQSLDVPVTLSQLSSTYIATLHQIAHDIREKQYLDNIGDDAADISVFVADEFMKIVLKHTEEMERFLRNKETGGMGYTLSA